MNCLRPPVASACFVPSDSQRLMGGLGVRERQGDAGLWATESTGSEKILNSPSVGAEVEEGTRKKLSLLGTPKSGLETSVLVPAGSLRRVRGLEVGPRGTWAGAGVTHPRALCQLCQVLTARDLSGWRSQHSGDCAPTPSQAGMVTACGKGLVLHR